MGCAPAGAVVNCHVKFPSRLLRQLRDRRAPRPVARARPRATHSRRQRRLRSSGHIRIYGPIAVAPGVVDAGELCAHWRCRDGFPVGHIRELECRLVFAAGALLSVHAHAVLAPSRTARHPGNFQRSVAAVRRRHERPGEGPQVPCAVRGLRSDCRARGHHTGMGTLELRSRARLDGSTVDGPANTRRVVGFSGDYRLDPRKHRHPRRAGIRV